jgi:hypothetical protein
MSSLIDDCYRRFSTERFLIPSEAEVAEFQRRIGVQLPERYRQFLLEYNGGYFNEPRIRAADPETPSDSLTCLHGLGASQEDGELDVKWRLNLFEDNSPPKVLPIGHTALGGSVVLVTQPQDSGTILFKKVFGDFYYLADGIEEFFGLLHERSE